MRGNSKRVAFGWVAGAAVASVIGLVGAPAYGQSAGVGNNGQASASTGDNSSVGNASDNTATTGSDVTQTSEPLVGGLLGLVLTLGGTATNDSSGDSTITTGAADATGNNSDTSVSQSGGGGVVGTVFGPNQSASVENNGSATASTGGNRGVGNGSTNVATNTQTVTGGLAAVGLNLTGGASNTSAGTSNITTGPATASGNEAVTTVDQQRVGRALRAGGGRACDGFFRFGGQRVEVDNLGTASASTGNNASVGNQSNNEATNTQTVSGGLIGLGVDLSGLLSGGASNESDGTSTISTGSAAATGNRSTTEVTQQCLEPAAVKSPLITPTIVEVISSKPSGTQQLAKTGVDPFVLGLVAFSLLFGGLMFMVWERAEAQPARRRRPIG